MKTGLSPDQISSYRKNGFIHQPGFLAPREVAELKDAVLSATRSMGKRKVAGDG